MNKQEEREQAILDICEQSAYEKRKTYLISFWELAGDLNNQWYANLFVSEKHKDKDYLYQKQWAVPSFALHSFFRMINWTMKRMKGVKIIKQDSYYKVFYEVPK